MNEFLEGGQRLCLLQKWQAPGVEQLERLRHKFDLAYATSTELHVALHFACLHHFPFRFEGLHVDLKVPHPVRFEP